MSIGDETMTVADPSVVFADGSLRGRYILAVANALMAAVVGTLTLGIGYGIVGALVLALLPFMPLIVPALVDFAKESPFGAALGAFLLVWIVGGIFIGLKFAVGVALVLAPTMIVLIVILTFGKPIPAGNH